MDDVQLLETIEKYLSGEMSEQEKIEFELLRKNTSDIDQLVVEHSLFLNQMDFFSQRKKFLQTTQTTYHQLKADGQWDIEESKSSRVKIIQLWSKYKKITAIAATVGGVIALITSSALMQFSKNIKDDQLLQLGKAIEVIKKNQQAQGHLLNEVKTKVPENAKLVSGGSGFLIDQKGFIITNAHVLKGEGAIVINSDGQEFYATIISSDELNDLAILKIEDKDYKQPKTIPYAIRKKMSNLGEEIFTLGFPRNDNDIVYGKGYLSAQTGYEGDSNSYQIQIGANPGYSGAPIFNEGGELIGVITTRQKQTENVAFAIKSTKIIEVIKQLKDNESTKNISIKLPKLTTNRTNRKNQLTNLKKYMYSVRSFH